MEIYLIAIAAIVLMNALPAFAPPTWMALVFSAADSDDCSFGGAWLYRLEIKVTRASC